MISTSSKVYFEKQGEDMLCGLHCINAILQGPVFDEVSLSQIAQQLDQEEALLLQGDAKKFKTSNVSLDGNYNI